MMFHNDTRGGVQDEGGALHSEESSLLSSYLIVCVGNTIASCRSVKPIRHFGNNT